MSNQTLELTINEHEHENPELNKAVNKKELDTFERLQEFKENLASSDFTIRVYRVSKGQKEFVGEHSELIEEPEIGKLYGGGKYQLYVRWKSGEMTKPKLDKITVNIGANWNRVHKAYIKEQNELEGIYENGGNPLAGLFKGMDIEKLIALIGGLKALMGNNGDNSLVTALMQNNNALMLKAMDSNKGTDINQTLLLEMIKDKSQGANAMIETMRDGMKFGMDLSDQKNESEKSINWNEIVQTAVEGVPELLKFYVTRSQVNRPEVQQVIQNDDAFKSWLQQSDQAHGKAKTNQVIKKFKLESRVQELGINRQISSAPAMQLPPEEPKRKPAPAPVPDVSVNNGVITL